MNAQDWFPTEEAAARLGMFHRTLKKKRDCSGGYLEHGVHWLAGESRSSKCYWNVPEIMKAMDKRGYKKILEFEIPRKPPEAGENLFGASSIDTDEA